jgi:hypothetical protein
VNYATANGTAQAPGDYTAKSGTLNWADGDSANKTFTVAVTNDASAEGPETVQLSLSGATGGATAGANATLVIDDTPGTILFTQTTFTALENAGTAKITVSRLGGSNGTVSVSFTTAEPTTLDCPDPINDPDNCEIAARVTAKPGEDYTPTSSPPLPPLTFANGETSKDIEIPLLFPANDPAEPNETLDIALCDATGTNVGNQVRATLTIADFQATASPGIVLSPIANNRVGEVPINMNPEITLSMLVDEKSLTETTAKIRCSGSTTDIPSAAATFDPDEMTVTIVPRDPLPTGESCRAVIASGIKDPSGNLISLPGGELTSPDGGFTPGSQSDNDKPVVSNPSPTPDTTLPVGSVVISADIDDYMLNTLSINPKNIQLSYTENTIERTVAGVVQFKPKPQTFPGSGQTVKIPVTFKPACPLKPNTKYTVRIKGPEAGKTKGIRDIAGNALAADVTWSFTTAP